MAAKLVVVNKKDLAQVVKNLELTGIKSKKILAKEINSTAQSIRTDSILNINTQGLVDTGTLKNSAKVEGKATSSNLNVGVGVFAKYAPYLEFGTGTKVDVPAGLENYAIQFKGKGIKQINITAKPFFFPAVFKNRAKFIENVKNALRKL